MMKAREVCYYTLSGRNHWFVLLHIDSNNRQHQLEVIPFPLALRLSHIKYISRAREKRRECFKNYSTSQ